jgi:Leucine-rich repeat (LRR) protein
LTTIILTNNKITELPVGVLDKSFKSSLEHLHADQNKISLLKNGLFEGNVNLKTINLAENTIDFIDTNVFHKHLTKLELVNISHNQLTQLLSNAFDKTKSFTPYVVFSVITDPEVGQLAATRHLKKRYNLTSVNQIINKLNLTDK